jgi:iron complex outermembrane receptor protein
MTIQNKSAARRLLSALLHGSALAGLAVFAGQAQAQQEAAATQVETVTVTGTSIRGAAPVGANVITVDRESIEATGATSVQQLLVNVPAVTGFGNAGQGGYGSFDGSGSNAPTIHSLGASASNSTLILVDSHRIPVSGLSHTLADPSTIPQIALQRVEVLPAGASSIYGSDAVAGVLNFITRKNFNGAETDVEYGAGLDYSSFNFGQIIGTTWDKGSVMAAYNFISRSALQGADRWFVNDNQTARNLGTFGNFNCSPATIASTSSSAVFTYPYTGTGITNSSANAPCGQTRQASLLPSDTRNAAFVSITDELTDWLTISSDLNWSNRVDNATVARGTVTATVFGPGSGKGSQINPFYVAVPGSTSGTETVRYDFNGLFGPGAHTKSGTEVVYGTVDFDAKLWGDWTASLNSMFGSSNASSRTRGTVCVPCANLALNGTTNANGSLTSSSNPTVLSTTTITTRPLSTANALNVWSTAGSTAAGGANTAAAVLTQLLDNDSYSQTTQTMNDVNLNVNGSLFTLPAGDIKAAFGGEYRNQGLTQYSVSNGNGGPSIVNSSIFDASFGRSLYAAFAEFNIPVISEDAGIPLVRRLNLDISGRFDHYNDFGDTKNPRVALDWEIVDGLKARASYGTSFVAPALTSTGGPAGRTIESAVSYGNTIGGQVTVPTGYSNLNAAPNATETAALGAGATVGNSINQGVIVAGPGGPTVQPETSLDYSAGFDWNVGRMFSGLNGLTVSATYWQTSYRGAITSPIAPLDVQIAGLNKNLIINPTDAQIAAAYDGTRRINSTPSGPVTFLQYYVQQNAFNLWANGIDYAVNYIFSVDGWGDFNVGVDGSQKLRFTQQNGGFGGALVDNLNRAGVNTTFSSLATTARFNLGWHMDPFKLDVAVNYTGAYHQTFSGSVYKVPSLLSTDVTAAYDLPVFNPWVSGTQVYVTALDVFNVSPPPYHAAVGYDNADANPLGRLVMFGLRKKW